MSKEHRWKELFQKQAAYGRRWKEIFGENHDSSIFLDRSDAVAIIKRAQLDVYDELLGDLENSSSYESASTYVYLKDKRAELALSDISALGMKGLDIEELRQKANDILENLTATELDDWLREYRKTHGKTS